VRILHLEDSPRDADLVLARLDQAASAIEMVRVQTRPTFVAALTGRRFDLILADFVLSDFHGLSALDLARELSPATPFIFVSGTRGEEAAIESLHRGALDYVLKNRLERLVPAVRRALGESERLMAHRREAAALRLALEAARMGTWEHDLETGTFRWSEGASRALGMRTEDCEGTFQGFLSRVHEDDRGRVRNALERTAMEVGDHMVEFRFQRADGELGWLNLAARVLPDPTGRPSRVVGVGTDMTDRRRSEEHLRQVQRMEALGRLAGGIAHEANNQMAVVLGFSDFVLRREEIPSDLRADVEQIRRAAVRTAAITQQLLTFSRRQVVRPEVLQVNEVIDSFEPVIRRSLTERSHVELRLQARGPVRIGRGQLEQVLLNLVLNAGDAMPEGGTVLVETRDTSLPSPNRPRVSGVNLTPGEYVELSIADSGIGMDRDTLDRVFEPFFTTKEVGKGTGLGLAAVYGIVKQADGYVFADSVPGRGTTFRVFLPTTAGALADCDRASGATRGSETLLVVEDQEEVRVTAARTLEEEGYQVLQAADGEKALEVLAGRDDDVRLVLSDLAMPCLGGRTMGDRLRDARPGLPVLFMSGYPEDDIRRRGMLEEGRPFIQKPFTPHDLARKVREVLDRS
jgi:two-component system, cell cycle sensor histidine kinase and response regulator CckA